MKLIGIKMSTNGYSLRASRVYAHDVTQRFLDWEDSGFPGDSQTTMVEVCHDCTRC